MNKYQLVKLQDKYILVSDEEKQIFDKVWNSHVGKVLTVSDVFMPHGDKIIAGLDNQPSIDFSLLSEVDCKTINFIDVEKLALLK